MSWYDDANSTSDNSRLGGHRRILSHGSTNKNHASSSKTSEAKPNGLGLSSTTLLGQTPSFEVSSDPLASTAPLQQQQPSSPPSLFSPQSTAVSVTPASPPTSFPLKHSPPQGFKRNLPQKAKTIQVDTTATHANWKRRFPNENDDGFKRPTSPHITTATPTSAYFHRAVSPLDPSSSSSSTAHRNAASPVMSRSPSIPARTNSNDYPARSHTPNSSHPSHLAPNRQNSLSRAAAAAQHMLDKVSSSVNGNAASSARASPVFFRSPNRTGSKDREDQFHHYDSALVDNDDDEEAGKGHGRDHHHHHNSRRTSVRWGTPGPMMYPRKQASDGGASGILTSPTTPGPTHRAVSRSGSRGASAAEHHDGRKTPAKYRPSPATKSHSDQHQHRIPPLPHSADDPHKSTRHPHSSISIGSTSSARDAFAGTGSSSPIVIPQARRGAINLKDCRSASKKRRKRLQKAKRRNQPSRPFHLAVLEFFRALRFHIFHPIHTACLVKSNISLTIRGIDVAFREPPIEHGQRTWWPEWIGAYIPLLIWLGISVSSTVIVLIFHTQVFRALDQLSRTLQSLGFTGRLLLGSLIFLTTFPPLPLYSTLIVLCGFSFGLWQGFIISYIAALSGAIVVYLLSKSLLRGWMTNLLSKSGGLKKVVRAIEKRPKLLFLIRLAPYPYNLMNTLLASSPTLTFKTYVTCTALALPKLLVHCGLGTSIKNFAAYHGAGGNKEGSDGTPGGKAPSSHTAETVKRAAGFIGVGLCIGIFLYLFSVARKAVDEELDDESGEEEAEAGGAPMRERRCRRTRREQCREYDPVNGDADIHDEEEDDVIFDKSDDGLEDSDDDESDHLLDDLSASEEDDYTYSASHTSMPSLTQDLSGSNTSLGAIQVNTIEALAESDTSSRPWISDQIISNAPSSDFRIASPDQVHDDDGGDLDSARMNWLGTTTTNVSGHSQQQIDDPYNSHKA
ncbi:unnamed protein product [Sympodiomycopsis kandeliae]